MKVKKIKGKTVLIFEGSRDKRVKESFSFATTEDTRITFLCDDDYQVMGVEIE